MELDVVVVETGVVVRQSMWNWWMELLSDGARVVVVVVGMDDVEAVAAVGGGRNEFVAVEVDDLSVAVEDAEFVVAAVVVAAVGCAGQRSWCAEFDGDDELAVVVVDDAAGPYAVVAVDGCLASRLGDEVEEAAVVVVAVGERALVV